MPQVFNRVHSLWINGEQMRQINFRFDGPLGDKHFGRIRKLDEHDGKTIRNSRLMRGHIILNTRSWTAVSFEELECVSKELGVQIPGGCLLENIVIRGIPNFSKLPPGTRLVFPEKVGGHQVILGVWEQNTPCATIGRRLANHYPTKMNLSSRLITAAKNKRGLMGFVISEGYVEEGDNVVVHLP